MTAADQERRPLLAKSVNVVVSSAWLYPFKVLFQAHSRLASRSYDFSPGRVGHLLLPRAPVPLAASPRAPVPVLPPLPRRLREPLLLGVSPAGRVLRALLWARARVGQRGVARPGRRRGDCCGAIRGVLCGRDPRRHFRCCACLRFVSALPPLTRDAFTLPIGAHT